VAKERRKEGRKETLCPDRADIPNCREWKEKKKKRSEEVGLIWFGKDLNRFVDRSQNDNNNNPACDDSKSSCSYLLSSACFFFLLVFFLRVGMYYASIEILMAQKPKHDSVQAPDIAPHHPTANADRDPDHRTSALGFGFIQKGGSIPLLYCVKPAPWADRYMVYCILYMPQVRYQKLDRCYLKHLYLGIPHTERTACACRPLPFFPPLSVGR